MKVMDQKPTLKEKRSVQLPQDFSWLDTESNQKTRNGHTSFLPPGFRKSQDSRIKSWQNLTRSGATFELQFSHPSFRLLEVFRKTGRKTHWGIRGRAAEFSELNEQRRSRRLTNRFFERRRVCPLGLKASPS